MPNASGATRDQHKSYFHTASEKIMAFMAFYCECGSGALPFPGAGLVAFRPIEICVNMNIPDYYDDVSIRLTEVLNRSGLGDDIRWWRINTWLQIEELERLFTRIVGNTRFKMCFFGSQPEATTTNELLSDIDQVSILNIIHVIPDLQFPGVCPETEETVLMVADEDTHPGYVKLQRVQRNESILVNNQLDKLFRLDKKCRSVLCSNTSARKFLAADEYHGPASTIFHKGIYVDSVFALHSILLAWAGFSVVVI
ncbi:hypothetical protein CHS0354_007610 [Potamilus streckersoni]|uniref:Uncharacterized protein n=1 Tax=Potamilus streckersoni TaxID=2493646 RepID=A0AAE0T4Y0_9BIVA|nr:hypothetical protein CHS0354_007610 [Potamilus streckersoni]